LLKQGDRAAAREGALRASEFALADLARHPEWPVARRMEQDGLLGHISGVLSEVGAYDEALATVQPIEEVNRKQFYMYVVEAAARARDTAAVDRLLPVAIAALKAPLPDWGSIQKLHRMIRSLALAGYGEAARSAFAELQTVHNALTGAGKLDPDPGMIAECAALTGDLASALTIVEKLGPLVEPPSPLMSVIATGMSFGGARAAPSETEMATRLTEVRKQLPPLVPGGKAHVLLKLAVDFAEMRDIETAIQLETALEAEPRDVLGQLRDSALAAISQAQQEAGDLRVSLRTALRITERSTRFERLLKLAAIPPQP
jgi:hypothetical protein